MSQSIYAGSMDVTYLVVIPSSRGPVRLRLSGGDLVLRAGTVTSMNLGEMDIAELYKKCPGVKIRPQIPSPRIPLAEAKTADVKAEKVAEPVRAREDDGTYKGDDPTTPEVNEAYVAPKKGKAKNQKDEDKG